MLLLLGACGPVAGGLQRPLAIPAGAELGSGLSRGLSGPGRPLFRYLRLHTRAERKTEGSLRLGESYTCAP